MPAQVSPKVENLGEFRSLSVPEIKSHDKNGLLEVQAKFVNTSHYDQQVFYRFKWLDADGFEVWDPEAWKPMVMIGKQTTAITSIAPTPKAKDFRIEIQAPHNKSAVNPN